MERGRASPAVETSTDSNVFDDSDEVPDMKLKATSPVAEILDHMKHPTYGAYWT